MSFGGRSGFLVASLWALAAFAAPVWAAEGPTAARKANACRPGEVSSAECRRTARATTLKPAKAQRPPRLTPEERRQLRRDIRDAGQKLYPKKRN